MYNRKLFYFTTFFEAFQVRITRMSKLFLLAILLHLFYNMITDRGVKSECLR